MPKLGGEWHRGQAMANETRENEEAVPFSSQACPSYAPSPRLPVTGLICSVQAHLGTEEAMRRWRHVSRSARPREAWQDGTDEEVRCMVGGTVRREPSRAWRQGSHRAGVAVSCLSNARKETTPLGPQSQGGIAPTLGASPFIPNTVRFHSAKLYGGAVFL